MRRVHFHRLRGGCLLFLCRQRFLIARPLVYEGSMLSTQLLSHPVGTRHAARGGERAWAGCALSRLVAVEPFVDMLFAYDSTVIDDSVVDCASCLQQLPFFLLQRLQCSSALFAAEGARVLQAHAFTQEPMHTTAHSAAHEQHTCKE